MPPVTINRPCRPNSNSPAQLVPISKTRCLQMAHPKLPIKRLVSAEVGASAKRRKIRKGTASCWECKRRKTKCIFSGSTESVCEGCTRRGTHCVTQEFSEDPSNQKQHFGDRLGRVERLLDGVFTKVNTGSDTTRELAPRTDGQLTPRVFQNFENVTQTNLANLGQLEHKEDGCRSGDEALTAHQFIQPQYHKKISPVLVKCPTEPGLIQALLSAWPSQSDLEGIYFQVSVCYCRVATVFRHVGVNSLIVLC